MPSQSGRRLKPAPGRARAAATSPTAAGTAASAKSWNQWVGIALGLVLLDLVVYAQTVRHPFVLVDDPIYVTNNPHVLSGIGWRNIAWSFAGFHDGNWIPLSWLSLMLDGSVWSNNPHGYHLTNLLLHLANTVLVFAVLFAATSRAWPSAAVAVLFGVHPLHVESVAWIAERKDVLSTLFGLISILFYIRYAQSGSGGKWAAALASTVLSLSAKPTLVTLPFVLLLLDYWPLGRLSFRMAPNPNASSVWRLIREKLPFFLVSAAFALIALRAQQSARAIASWQAVSLTVRLENSVVVYATYLGHALWPASLAVHYPHPGAKIGSLTLLVATATLTSISAIALFALRRARFLFVGWAWYLGTLVPMIGLVQIGRQQMADRYTYFPLIGILIGVAWTAAEIVSRFPSTKRAAVAAGSLAIAAYCAAGYVQAGYWRDSLILLRHAIDCGQDSGVARSALGSALVAQGKTGEALGLLQSAALMEPLDEEIRYNLAVGLQKGGQLDRAAEEYRLALSLNDRDADAYANLGVLLAMQGRFDQAEQHLQRALTIDAEHLNALVNLQQVYLETKRYSDAAAASRRTLDIDPGSLPSRRHLVIALLELGRTQDAIAELRRILSEDPADEESRALLARAQSAGHRGS